MKNPNRKNEEQGPVPQRFVTLRTRKLFTNFVELCLRVFHKTIRTFPFCSQITTNS